MIDEHIQCPFCGQPDTFHIAEAKDTTPLIQTVGKLQGVKHYARGATTYQARFKCDHCNSETNIKTYDFQYLCNIVRVFGFKTTADLFEKAWNEAD